jgi:osmotically-inducible protein OsmY
LRITEQQLDRLSVETILSDITTKVKSLLAADDFLKSFEISVETYKGTVQLSGFVSSQQAVDKAVQITRSVKGVKSVKNDLIVK